MSVFQSISFSGLGVGIGSMFVLIIPAFYFKRKRGTASAIVLSASNLGSVVGPPLVSYLQLQYGFRGAMLIIAAIILHGCFSATVFHPVEWHTRGRSITTAKESIKPSKEKNMANTFTSYLRLLKSARTFVIIIAYSAVHSILRTGVSLLPLVLETFGHTQGDATFITSVVGVCGFVARMTIPSLADIAPWFNKRVGYIVCTFAVIASLIGNIQAHETLSCNHYCMPFNHAFCKDL